MYDTTAGRLNWDRVGICNPDGTCREWAIKKLATRKRNEAAIKGNNKCKMNGEFSNGCVQSVRFAQVTKKKD